MVKRLQKKAPDKDRSVTQERCRRLARLIQLLGNGPRERSSLLKLLRLELRGFYRDLDFVRDAGIPITIRKHRYELRLPAREAIRMIPFPDPALTLGEVELLIKGKSKAHVRLRKRFQSLVPAPLR